MDSSTTLKEFPFHLISQMTRRTSIGTNTEIRKWMAESLNSEIQWVRVDVSCKMTNGHAAILRRHKRLNGNKDVMQYLADKIFIYNTD